MSLYSADATIGQLVTAPSVTNEYTIPTFYGSATYKTSIGDILALVTKSTVGLANVDNTSDANKPISNATASALSAKADVTHTHGIQQVTGLSTALADKATLVHMHNSTDVAGLDAALAGKADIAHVHEMTQVNGLPLALSNKADTVTMNALLAGKSNTGHTHTAAEISGIPQIPADLATQSFVTAAIAAEPVHAHVHQVSDVNNLQPLLDSKAPVVHQHEIANVNNLTSVLASKVDATTLSSQLTGKANVGHLHELSEVNGLNAALVLKAEQAAVDVLITDVDDLYTTVGNKANTLHTHQISQVVNLQDSLDMKAGLDHTHGIADINSLSSALADKTDIGHNHTTSDVSGFSASVKEIVGAMIVPGTNVTIAQDQGNLIISSAGGGGGSSARQPRVKIFSLRGSNNMSWGATISNNVVLATEIIGNDVVDYSSYGGDTFTFNEAGTYRIHLSCQSSVSNDIKVDGVFTPSRNPTTLVNVRYGQTVQGSALVIGPNEFMGRTVLDMNGTPEPVDKIHAWDNEFYVKVANPGQTLTLQSFLYHPDYDRADFDPNEWLLSTSANVMIEQLYDSTALEGKVGDIYGVRKLEAMYVSADTTDPQRNWSPSGANSDYLTSPNVNFNWDSYAGGLILPKAGYYRVSVGMKITKTNYGDTMIPDNRQTPYKYSLSTKITPGMDLSIYTGVQFVDKGVYLFDQSENIASSHHEFYIVAEFDGASFDIGSAFTCPGLASAGWMLTYIATVGMERLGDRYVPVANA